MSELGFYVTTTTGKKVRIVGSENGGPLGSILVDDEGGKWRRTGSATQLAAVEAPEADEPTFDPEPLPEPEPEPEPETVGEVLVELHAPETPDADAAGEAGSDTVEEPPSAEE